MLPFLLFLFGASLGVFGCSTYARKIIRGLRESEEETRLALIEAESSRKFLEKRVTLRDRQLASATEERDDFAKVAATHALTPDRWKAGEWARKVWKDRRYSGHPAQNLEDLRRDFETFAEQHVLVAFDIEVLGGWKQLLQPADVPSGITTPLSAGDTLLFEGTGARVFEQILTFIRDDDTGFWISGEGESDQGKWRDPDSPMVWRLTVDVLQSETPPDTNFVEVLRIQKEYVETVIEKPVVRSVPDDVASSLSRHTREEIVTLIEAVLEVRELGLAERIEAQRALLPADLQQPSAAPDETPADDGDQVPQKVV